MQERIYYKKPFFDSLQDKEGRYYADVYIRDVWGEEQEEDKKDEKIKPLINVSEEEEKKIKPLINVSKERTGYPTQKPLTLLERIIKASSNEGDIVLDPFCGCATTSVAAEGLKRKWIGIDISIKAYELVQKRLNDELEKRYGQIYVPEVCFSASPPKRTDSGATDAEQKYVYIISNASYPGEYKVGIAKDWRARLNSYQTSDPNRGYKLEYKLHTSKFREIEKQVHEQFENKHEWVQADLLEVKSFIEKLL